MTSWLEGGVVHRDPLWDVQDADADRELLGGTLGGDTSAETPSVRNDDEAELPDCARESLGQLVVFEIEEAA